MTEFLKDNPDKTNDISEHLILYIKSKLKDWKESNFNINKEAILALIQIIQNNKGIDKKLGRILFKGLHEKLVDNKVKDQLVNLYFLIMEHLTPTFALGILLKLLKNAKSPNMLKDYADFFEKVIDEFGINFIPVKELVEFGKILASHTNPQVRTSATTLLSVLYKFVGKDLLILLKDIKESTLKIIEESFKEIKVVTNKSEIEKPKRIIKTNTVTNLTTNPTSISNKNNIEHDQSACKS